MAKGLGKGREGALSEVADAVKGRFAAGRRGALLVSLSAASIVVRDYQLACRSGSPTSGLRGSLGL